MPLWRSCDFGAAIGPRVSRSGFHGTLQKRQLRGGLIEVFKIINITDNVSFQNYWFQSSHSGLGHSYKFLSGRFLHDISKYRFSNRVIDDMNQPPEDTVNCTLVNSSKNRLDRFMHKRGWFIQICRKAVSLPHIKSCPSC